MTILRQLAALMVAASLSPLAQAAPLVIVTEKASPYVVVLPAEPSPTERYAAQELIQHVAAVTGVTLPLATTAPPDRGLYVGYGLQARQRFPAIDLKPLDTDGFTRRIVGGDLLLAGGSPRGTLYAVDDWLESCLGIRWLTPDATHWPPQTTVTVPAGDLVRRPAFTCRDVYIFSAFDGTWATRNRVNGHGSRLTAEQGGRFPWAHPPVHTFAWLLPHKQFWPAQADLYMHDHVKGRVPVSLCLTNPTTRAAVTERVRSWMKEQPDRRVFSVSQNDWRYRCACPQCQQSEARHGTPSGPLLELVNAVADGVAEEFPDRLVETLAHDYTADPPQKLAARPNVLIRLCMMGDRASCQRWLDGWKGRTEHLHVWDYVTGFSHFHIPFPNLPSFAPYLKQYRDAGATGVLMQGNYRSPGGTFGEFKSIEQYRQEQEALR